MSNVTSGAMAIALAQIVSSIVIALVLNGFFRQYRKTYLLHWTLGWTAQVFFQVATQATLTLALFGLPASHPARIAISAIGGICGFLGIVWLIFGVYELVLRRPIRLATGRNLLLGAGAFGLLTALLLIHPSVTPEYRYVIRIGTRATVAAVTFAAAGWALWRARRGREGVGFTILSSAFFLYAAEQLHYASLGGAWILSGSQAPYAAWYVGYLDLVLIGLMGMGMVASLLEDEREAAELAAIQIEHLAYHDALTGLPNRPLFSDRLIVALAQATRGKHRLAILFLDLDRFKDINDSLGHSLGDSLLKAVAERIRRCVREGDTVARFGGDEFTLLIPRIEHVEDAAKIAQKIIDTLKIPFLIQERELFITTSIGITIFPTDGNDPEMLVRNADTAMYRAKEQGRDNYQLYAPAMNARALERLSLENTLRKAVAQDELVLHYQPVIDLKTSRVVAVEALVRWNHPDLGLLLPAHFISVAELSGVILPVGEWVLDTACRQIHAWQRRHPVTVSVNLSARQFQQPDVVQQVRRAIETNHIDPSRLQIEITESNAMQHAENTIHVLREFKSLGIRIAMDDFGTGYSSLSYLKRFPIDTLKLDASFVEDIATDETDAAIASAVIAMAHSLRVDVVAEGVEREDQLAVLAKHDCDLIQGFLFSQAIDAESLERYLEEQTRTAKAPRPFTPAAEAPL